MKEKMTLEAPPSRGWRWVPSLYLFQGIPSCMVMTMSALFFQDMGVGIESFAFWTSVVCLPWSLKPLWAPVVERVATKRQWVMVTEAVLAGLFLALGCAVLSHEWFYPMCLGLMLLIAFASASHDIACDAYYMMALPLRDQDFFVGIRSTFYRVAMVATVGAIPYISGRVGMLYGEALGWTLGFFALGVVLALLLVINSGGMPHVDEPAGRRDNELLILLRAFRSFFSHPGMAPTVCFFLLYRLGEAQLVKVVTPFLVDARSVGGLGLSVDACGVTYGTFGVLALVAGGVAGGWCAARYGLKRCLWPMVALMTLPNIGYVLLAHYQPAAASWWVDAAVVTEQLGYGYGFTAYMLLMLRYVGGAEYKAAEYAIGTSLMSLSLIVPGMAAGVLKAALGYELFFALACVLTLPGIVCAAVVYRRMEE